MIWDYLITRATLDPVYRSVQREMDGDSTNTVGFKGRSRGVSHAVCLFDVFNGVDDDVLEDGL